MNPAPSVAALPSAFNPRPLICECDAMRDARAAEDEDGGGRGALCAGVAEDEGLGAIGLCWCR